MRIDSLHPDSDVLLSIGGGPEITATFVSMSGEKEERVAMFVSPDTETGELFRWPASRHKGRWVTGTKPWPLKLIRVLRDPRFPDLSEPVGERTLQYGYQPVNSETVVWTDDKETAEQIVNSDGGRVVYRTVTYGAIIEQI